MGSWSWRGSEEPGWSQGPWELHGFSSRTCDVAQKPNVLPWVSSHGGWRNKGWVGGWGGVGVWVWGVLAGCCVYPGCGGPWEEPGLPWGRCGGLLRKGTAASVGAKRLPRRRSQVLGPKHPRRAVSWHLTVVDGAQRGPSRREEEDEQRWMAAPRAWWGACGAWQVTPSLDTCTRPKEGSRHEPLGRAGLGRVVGPSRDPAALASPDRGLEGEEGRGVGTSGVWKCSAGFYSKETRDPVG